MTTSLCGSSLSTSTRARARQLTVLVCVALSACGGGGGGGAGGGAGLGQIRLVLSPAEANLSAGGSVRFVAEVSGTTDRRVRFELVSGPGAVTDEGLYSAPATLEAAATTAAVRAIALADERAAAIATVRLESGGSGNGGALESLAAQVGTSLATEVGDASRRSLLQCVAAAVEAARLTGRPLPVLVGTLRAQGGQATYEPTPTDRLVVLSGSGPAATYRIATLNGAFGEGGNAFFDGDHDLDARLELTGSIDMQATSQRRGRTALRTLRGSAIVAGNSFAVDVTETDDNEFESSGGGIQARVTTSVRGNAEGQGIRVQVQEDVNVLVQRTTFFSVETQRAFASSWEASGTRYELRGGRLNKVFRDTRATEPSFWRAEGTIYRDGVAIGSLRGDFEDSFYVVRLLRGDERLELLRVFLNL